MDELQGEVDELKRQLEFERHKAEVARLRQQNEDLRVYQVLDECEGSDVDDNVEHHSEVEFDISDNEIEAMLEEGFEKGVKTKDESNGNSQDDSGIRYTENKTSILEELGYNHFEMLPEGWIKIIHKSGMPIYLHKATRVCTFSRPYYLGQGSVRKHNVPLSAIPCLQYRRALDEEETRKKEEGDALNVKSDGPQYLHTAKIETTEENKLSQSLGAFTLQQYCKKLFRFKKEQRLHFVSWADRRRYLKAKKIEKEQHRPSFPDGTKLIKFPIQNPDDDPKAKPRGEWIMNPNGKSYICILHEYVQHALKKQPTYEFKALENPSTPYSATVIINDMKYGYGTGTSKKQAKLAAAKASLEILIPEMREKIRSDNKNGKRSGIKASLEILIPEMREKIRSDNKNGKRSGITNFPDEEETSLSIFDEIRIEDPRVAEFCAKTTEPSPYSILLTCLQRNFGLKEMPIDYKVNPLHRQSNEFIMTVGKHTARIICKNKKEGKQRASQAILQDLHPHITSWGALLRLYGNRSVRNVKEKKQEEQEITMLQSKASLNSPNYSIINKLRSEMNKLYEQQMMVKPIGLFIPPAGTSLPSSGTELNKVDF
uniref:Pasha-PAa n=1 Tax=Nezara viridula TaxID=85310 RepID=A0A2P1DM79_NEZVI|nr:Pasha-PAa [Nezara viridula]